MLRMVPLVSFAMLVGLASLGAGSTNTAPVHLYCLSVRVEPGSARIFGLDYSLALSSGTLDSPNHELYPIFDEQASHASGFLFEATDFPEPITGQLAVNVPENLDANTNGVPDFYEVAASIPSTTTTGFWDSDFGSGTLRAVWQRPAGEHRGSCRIQLKSPDFGDLPELTHAFEIIEYSGSLRYTPGPDPIRGVVDLHRVHVEAEKLTGPLEMTRVATNHLKQFSIGTSTLTNAAGLAVPVSLGDVEMDPDYRSSYFGALSLLNGDPTTPEVDYELFYIGIDDRNDADHDGIPDLTDDPSTAPAGGTLGIEREGEGFRLRVLGEVGVTYRLERTRILPAEGWVMDRSLTLTNTNQVVVLPAFSPNAEFWRLSRP